MFFRGLKRKVPKRLPRQQHPTRIAEMYFADIKRHVLDPLHVLWYKHGLPVLLALRVDSYGWDQMWYVRLTPYFARLDASSKTVHDAINEIAATFVRNTPTRSLEGLAERYARETSEWQKQQLGLAMKAAIGVALVPEGKDLPERFANFASENAALITGMTNELTDSIAKTVTQGIADGDRAEDIAADIEDRFDVGASRAALIARDQVGKFYGDLNKARQTELGVAGYTWRTMHDQRVRDEHVELDGKHFEWDDPPEDGHPGEPILCRCFAEPDFSGILEEE